MTSSWKKIFYHRFGDNHRMWKNTVFSSWICFVAFPISLIFPKHCRVGKYSKFDLPRPGIIKFRTCNYPTNHYLWPSEFNVRTILLIYFKKRGLVLFDRYSIIFMFLFLHRRRVLGVSRPEPNFSGISLSRFDTTVTLLCNIFYWKMTAPFRWCRGII